MPTSTSKFSSATIAIIIGVVILLAGSGWLLRMQLQSSRAGEEVARLQFVSTPSPVSTPDTTSSPSPSSQPVATEQPTNTPKVSYAKIAPSDTRFVSALGYSFNWPVSYTTVTESEKLSNQACVVSATNNAGGVISARVVPYNNGSRRVLMSTPEPTYSYRYYEVVGDGYTGLFRESIDQSLYSENDPGVFHSEVVIPRGNTALVFSISNGAFDSDRVKTILGSLTIPRTLSLSSCPTVVGTLQAK